MPLLGGLFSRYAGAVSPLGREHAVDHTPCPQGSGIDVEVIERLARVLVDGGLLGFQHGMVLIAIATDTAPEKVLEFARERKLAARLALGGELCEQHGNPR